MNDQAVYHAKMRALQDRYGTRRLADALAEHRRRAVFSEEDVAFIEAQPAFFLATADADGAPDCSYKGALPGHVRVTGPAALSFPSLDGNGMYRSLGNILANPQVGILFIAYGEPARLRVNGRAQIDFDDKRLAEIPGAELMVRVEVEAIFSNCPRYIQTAHGQSDYFDMGDGKVKRPDWKSRDYIVDTLPEGK